MDGKNVNNSSNNDSYRKGDLVLVQPMRYCISFTEGDIDNLGQEEGKDFDPNVPKKITHHWSEDGFKARVLDARTVETTQGGEENYLLVKLFGQGRKHFTKRDGEKTKEVWVHERLVSFCRDENKKR